MSLALIKCQVLGLGLETQVLGLEAQVLGLGLEAQVLGLDLGLEAQVLGLGFGLEAQVLGLGLETQVLVNITARKGIQSPKNSLQSPWIDTCLIVTDPIVVELLSAPLRSNGGQLCFATVYFFYLYFFLFTVRSQKLLNRFSQNFQELCILV